MAIDGQTPLNIGTIIDKELQGFTENLDVDISAGTVSNPVNILLITHMRKRLSLNFKSTKSAQVVIRGSSDRNADATANTITGNFANVLISPATIISNLEGFYETWNTAFYAFLVQAYPSTGVSGSVEISVHARVRDD